MNKFKKKRFNDAQGMPLPVVGRGPETREIEGTRLKKPKHERKSGQ